MNAKDGIVVVFDFNRTLYDPDTKALLPGVMQLLDELKARSVPMYLVSKADESRPQLLGELGLEGFFADSFFVERKDPALFLEITRRANVHPKDTYVIGDYLHKEIRSGNQSGMKTIWLKRGKFADLKPESETDVPWRTVEEMNDVLELIG